MKPALEPVYTAQQLAKRVTALGKLISRDYQDRTLDVVIVLDSAFVFAADLIRRITCPVVCHFVWAEIRDLQFSGYDRREISFSRSPRLENRDVLVVDAVVQSGLTQDFLMKRLQETRPRSLRLAALFDKPSERRVDLKPDYFCFAAASKYLAGYGLAGSRGWYRNVPYVGVQPRRARRVGMSGVPVTVRKERGSA
ncbi:MAG TPA: phosphoribosyltransferase family protein [Candidatus Acidoferrales bacterium]|nr:phosphoribosyltransferase family protein [Candidatus Acidoferrales bacterium]